MSNYSNSPLATETYYSKWYGSRNGKAITKITPHISGTINNSLAAFGVGFNTDREASANYAIDSEGKIALLVDEANRSIASCSVANDSVAVTIEVVNCGGRSEGWPVTKKAYDALIQLCVDICRRNGIKKLNYTGDTTGNLTRHNMFIATECPGPYLQAKLPDLAARVNALLKGQSEINEQDEPKTETIYKVQVGAFGVKSNAEKLAEKLKSEGYSTYLVFDYGYYKVQVGAYTKKENAVKMEEKLKAAGYQTYLVSKTGKVVEEPLKIEYRVRPNDALSLIAERYQTSVSKLMQDNRIQNANMIYVNQLLIIYPGVK